MSADRIAWTRRALHALVWVGVFGAVAKVALAGPGNGNGNGNNGNPGGPDAETLTLAGIVRDFAPDHPDFDVVPPEGYGQYMWNIATLIGQNDKPIYMGGGYKVAQQAHDAAGRDICWTLYDPDAGDTPAQPGAADSGSIESAQTFAQWFKDNPGINMSTIFEVSGVLQTSGEFAGMYEINEPQFYPVDGLLLGDDGEHNNFFTCEIIAEFEYDSSAGYELYFKSDDDAWVYIGGQLAADLGGINGSPEQWIELDRLGLIDGMTYVVRFFKADRSNASSRFHLVTNLPLRSVIDQTVLAAFD